MSAPSLGIVQRDPSRRSLRYGGKHPAGSGNQLAN
jgi:hypothetical protein